MREKGNNCFIFFFCEICNFFRAEFANEEYLPVTNSILENIVVVKKNLNY